MRSIPFAVVILIVVLIGLVPLIYGIQSGAIVNQRGYFTNLFAADGATVLAHSGPLNQEDNGVDIGALSYGHQSNASLLLNFWEAPYFTGSARNSSYAYLSIIVGSPIFYGNISADGETNSSFVIIAFNNQTKIQENLNYVKDGYRTWKFTSNSTDASVAFDFPIDPNTIHNINVLNVAVGPNTEINISSVSLQLTTYVLNVRSPYISKLPIMMIIDIAIGSLLGELWLMAKIIRGVMQSSRS